MKVTIREWKLKKGRCLYLDIYDRGVRKRENLRITLTGEKLADDEKMRMAKIVRSRRENELIADIHGLVAASRSTVTVVDYAQKYGGTIVKLQWKRLGEFFGPMQLGAVTLEILEAYQAALLKELQNSTVQTYINGLVAVFNDAVKHRMIAVSPTKGLKRVKAKDRPPSSLTDEEMDLLARTPIQREPGQGGQIKRAFLFACMTGLRWSDCCALTWGKIRDRQVEATQQKTGAAVYVPLNDRAWAMISPGDRIPARDEKVFRLSLMGDPGIFLRPWGEAAGIGKIHFHQSRHTFPRFLLDQGVDLVTVQALMGHKDISTTARYGRASDAQKRDAVKRLDRKAT